MDFSPAFTSTWDAPLLNAMLLQLRAGQDSGDVSMAAGDESILEQNGLGGEDTVELNSMESEDIVELSGVEGGSIVELNSMEGGSIVELGGVESGSIVELSSMEGGSIVELSSMEGEEECFSEGRKYEMFESTILLEDTDDSYASSEQFESGSDLSLKYIVGCPVHNHHTDSQSVCPDDPPCVCLL